MNLYIKHTVLIIFFLCLSSISQGKVIGIDNIRDGSLDIKNEILVYLDSTNSDFPDHLPLSQFKTLPTLSDDQKYSNEGGASWFFFTLKNTSSEPVSINLFTGDFKIFHAYVQEGDEWNHMKSGYDVKKKNRPHIYENIFPITIAPESESKVFLKYEDVFKKSWLDFQILSNYKLVSDPPLPIRMPFNFALINALFFGVLLFVIVFSIVQYFQVREVSYLYYAGYLVSIGLFYLIRFETWYPEFSLFFSYFIPNLNHFHVPISMLIYITYTMFIFKFLDLDKKNPDEYKRITWVVYLFIFYIFLDKFFWMIGGSELSRSMFNGFRAIMLPIGLVYAIYLIYKYRSQLTIYVLVGSLFLMVGALIGLVLTMIDIDHQGVWYFPVFYVILGVLGEVIFFSAGLGYKNRLEIENKNKALLKAMRSQMNPHFIFNGLNSIKQLIYEKNDKSAIRYLTRFAKMFRKVLSNSDKDLITLEEELEMCKVFLQIESLRFKDKFEYEFQVDENIDLNMVDIPPMTIQPHLENAIWHGLLPKEKDCKLNIIIENNNGFIKCIIDDNGIGRAASKELKVNSTNTKKESFGIKLSTERLMYNNIKLNIIDKLDGEQNSLGTQVEILIPQ